MEKVDSHTRQQHDFVEYSSVRSWLCCQSTEIKKVCSDKEKWILSSWKCEVTTLFLQLYLGKQRRSAELNEVGEDRLEGCSDPAWKVQTLGTGWGDGWVWTSSRRRGPPHLLLPGCGQSCCCSWGRCPEQTQQLWGWQRRPRAPGADGHCLSLPGQWVWDLSIRPLMPQEAHKCHELCFASTLLLLRPGWWKRGDGCESVVPDVPITGTNTLTFTNLMNSGITKCCS